MANILIVDDDEMMCEVLSRRITGLGHTARTAGTVAQASLMSSGEAFDVVFLDVELPDGNGLDLLPRLREASSLPEVIIITGAGGQDGAELAFKSGAWDYIRKPFSKKEVALQLSRALEYREKKSARPAPVALKRGGLIGNSPRLNACLDLVAQAARSDASVLIVGETGTGKELFARAIHENSARSRKDFVVVDCTVLPDTLAESVLFGHRKGAFTGADRSHDGLVKQADGGSLFLDEIGELPLSLQKSFLRVLQEHTFRPVGENRELKSDFRLIAATNRDLDGMADGDRFRRDLLFRLRAITLELPPLRARPEDIKEIAIHHVARICEKSRLETKGFSPEFFQVLQSYRWPGNVRELLNALESAVAVDLFNPVLFPKHLPVHIRTEVARARRSIITGKDVERDECDEPDDHDQYDRLGEHDEHHELDEHDDPMLHQGADEHPELPSLKAFRAKSMADLERHYLRKLMTITAGNIKDACRISGVSRTRLYELLKQHDLSRRFESP